MSYLYRRTFGKSRLNEPFEKLKKQIEDIIGPKNPKKKDYIDPKNPKKEEDNSIEDDEEESLSHIFDPNKENNKPADENLINNQPQISLIDDDNNRPADINDGNLNNNQPQINLIDDDNNRPDDINNGNLIYNQPQIGLIDDNNSDKKPEIPINVSLGSQLLQKLPKANKRQINNKPIFKRKENNDNNENINTNKDNINLIENKVEDKENKNKDNKDNIDKKENDIKISVMALNINKKDKKNNNNEENDNNNLIDKIDESDKINNQQERDNKNNEKNNDINNFNKNNNKEDEKGNEEEKKPTSLLSHMKSLKGQKNIKSKSKSKKSDKDLIDEICSIEKETNNDIKKENDTNSMNIINNAQNLNPGVYDKDDVSSKISNAEDNFFDNTEINISMDKVYENKDEKKNEKNTQDNKNLIIDKKKNDLIDVEEGIENFDLEEIEDKDKEYPNDNKREEKKDNNTKNNFMNKSDKSDKTKKKQKKTKKKKYPANPPIPKKSGAIDINNSNKSNDKKSDKQSSNNNTSYISDKKIDQYYDHKFARSSSERIHILQQPENKEEEQSININGFLLDIMKFDDAKKKDKRNFFFTLLSTIKYNSILIFALPIDTNDLFTKVSVIILSLSLYIFLNIICMYNLSMLHLYIGGDKDPNKKSQPKYNAINILVPFLLLYLPTMFLKKLLSIREFIFEQNYKYNDIINSKKFNKAQKQLRLHDIETQINKFRNKNEDNSFKVFLFGGIFLVFNWYLATCFCGIYENSNLCLILNTLISIIFTYAFAYIFFLASSIIRRCVLSSGKWEIVYKISGCLNPTILLYSEEIWRFLKTILIIVFSIVALFILFS